MNASLDIVVAGKHTSGDDLFREAMRAAAGLADKGIGRADRVAVLMRNDLALLQATLAVTHLGAYPVQLNWHGTPDEIAWMLSDCKPNLLIGHADLLVDLGDSRPDDLMTIGMPTPEGIAIAFQIPPEKCEVPAGVVEWNPWLGRYEPLDRQAVPGGENIVYTSGTSGKPKGVLRFAPTPEQAVASDEMRREVFGVYLGSRALVPAPLYHIPPSVFASRALRFGELLLLPARFDPEELLRDIERYRITHLYAVTTMFVRLLRLPADIRDAYDLSSLQFVLHGAGPCPRDVKRAMIDWWGPVLHEYYGATELGPVTYCTSDEWLAKPGTAGKAVPGVLIEIRDEQGNALPCGETGQIWTINPTYPDFTYLNGQEAREALQRDGLLASGDLGFIDEDGYLFLLDRDRDLVISGGVNIYPAEIEAALIQFDGIADCAVFGIPHEEFGEELMAAVQPANDWNLDADEIVAFLRTRLAGYKVPRKIEFRDDLPREESGKIRKRLLRDPYWEGRRRI